ncbi:MAG TPA: DUF6786 family protein [Bacteroidales bacterium]|nr:DUF6786 family protein [Bacteroidales bacterium]
MRTNIFLILIILLPVFACSTQVNTDRKLKKHMKQSEENTYSEDKSFLKKYCDLIELNYGDAKILLSKDYQGKVFTSTATGDNGLSFGWINYNLFKSGKVSTQFNPYGGEERFWLGPEGGPFSIYFEKGKEQIFENWVVPKELDVLAFDVVRKTPQSVSFQKEFTLKNYTGTILNIGIERNVKLLEPKEVENALNCPIDKSLKYVAYESENILINNGVTEWNKQTGVLSLWMLSMFSPSTVGVVFIPFKKQSEESNLSGIVTDDYFGKVPGDRLLIKDGIIYFKTDGKYRSKIGVTPKFALPYCGSYDSQKQVLTLLWFSIPEEPSEYVNSKWGNQDPFKGDVVNLYNDGPVEDGSIMGPFYEIESSSPAAYLSPGQKTIHTQRIFHITGDEKKLSLITEKIFNLSITEIKEAFGKN